jgi:hypothetical protein
MKEIDKCAVCGRSEAVTYLHHPNFGNAENHKFVSVTEQNEEENKNLYQTKDKTTALQTQISPYLSLLLL